MSHAEIWLYIGVSAYVIVALSLTFGLLRYYLERHAADDPPVGTILFRIAVLCFLWVPALITIGVVWALGIEKETMNYIETGKFE